MIFETLEILQKQLDEELSLSTLNWSSDNKVVLSNLYGSDGQLALARNCVAISLINMEETHVDQPGKTTRVGAGGGSEHKRPPLTITLSVLFTANFEHYEQSLKILAFVMGYFQNNPSLTRKDVPAMPESMQQLQFKLFSQNLDQAKDIWSFLGGRYLPSVMYNIRGTEIHSDQVFATSKTADGTSPPSTERLDDI